MKISVQNPPKLTKLTGSLACKPSSLTHIRNTHSFSVHFIYRIGASCVYRDCGVWPTSQWIISPFCLLTLVAGGQQIRGLSVISRSAHRTVGRIKVLIMRPFAFVLFVWCVCAGGRSAYAKCDDPIMGCVRKCWGRLAIVGCGRWRECFFFVWKVWVE